MNIPEVFSAWSVCLQVYHSRVVVSCFDVIDVCAKCGFDSVLEIYYLTNLSLLSCAYWRAHVTAFVRLLTKVGRFADE